MLNLEWVIGPFNFFFCIVFDIFIFYFSTNVIINKKGPNTTPRKLEEILDPEWAESSGFGMGCTDF